LVALVIVFGFFPNLLSYSLIEPAVASIHPGQLYDVHIQFWHGWNTEITMTIGVVVAGSLLYFGLRYWQSVYRLFPHRWSLNRLYDNVLRWMEGGSRSLNAAHMTGS